MALMKQLPFYKTTVTFPLLRISLGTFATASSQSAISPCSINSALMLKIHIKVADEEPAGRCIAYAVAAEGYCEVFGLSLTRN